MAAVRMRRKPPTPFMRVTPETKRAREVVGTLTDPARLVMSRLKEDRKATALSLPELAMAIDPGLPGLLASARAEGEDAWEARERRFDPSRTTENLILDDRQRANIAWRVRAAEAEKNAGPIEHRLLPDGGLLPALGDHPAWGVSLQRARAVIVELETLGLLTSVEVRGASVSEKWTLTDWGRTVVRVVSVHEWRKVKAEAGKSEG